MAQTDTRVRIGDSDADGLVADIRTTDPASDTPGTVVRIAGTLPAPAVSIGAATSAKQDTGNASLASLDGKTTAINTGAVTISAALPAGSNAIGTVAPTLVATNAYARSVATSLGAAATGNIKASAGNIYSLTCYNANGSARYFQIWNSATDASAGSLLATFLVPTASQIVVGMDFFSHEGLYCSGGIAFGFSTAINSYAAGSAGDCTCVVVYK